jgi:hypothetical protein
MTDVPIPDKPQKKDGIWKEAEWREQWRLYNDLYAATQTDHKIRLLLKWFKEDFFTWVNSPQCASCEVPPRPLGGGALMSKGDTKPSGRSEPTEEERRYTARGAELSRCQKCGRIERFPRYNDPVKLLSTRRGRCGEYANVPSPPSSSLTVGFCIYGAEYGRPHSLGVEFRGPCLGGILLESTGPMDSFGSV